MELGLRVLALEALGCHGLQVHSGHITYWLTWQSTGQLVEHFTVWREAMVEEYASIMQNDVWEVVPRPDGKSMISSKWNYKIKYATDGSIEKYKARFVARGFSQREGVDYSETFTPVA
jgi:hypothetical protein